MTPQQFGRMVDLEIRSVSAAADARERALDEHGYGGGKDPVDPLQLTGLSGYIPALRLYTDELVALRKMRDGVAELLEDVTRWLIENGPNPDLRAAHCRLRILLAAPIVVVEKVGQL